MIKLLGAVCVVTACGWFGFSLSLAHRREERALSSLIAALDYFQCELQYKMTPLPQLCSQVSAGRNDCIAQIFSRTGKLLEAMTGNDVFSCVNQACREAADLPPKTSRILAEFGKTLGAFDLDGQLLGIEAVRQTCRQELEQLRNNREERLRSYQTLGLCAGAALAILFV